MKTKTYLKFPYSGADTSLQKTSDTVLAALNETDPFRNLRRDYRMCFGPALAGRKVLDDKAFDAGIHSLVNDFSRSGKIKISRDLTLSVMQNIKSPDGS